MTRKPSGNMDVILKGLLIIFLVVFLLGTLAWRINVWVKHDSHLKEKYGTSELIRFVRNIESTSNDDSKGASFLYVNNEKSPFLNNHDTFYAIEIDYNQVFMSLNFDAVKKFDDNYVYLTGSHKGNVLIPNEHISIVDLSEPKGEIYIKNVTSTWKNDIEEELNNSERWYNVLEYTKELVY